MSMFQSLARTCVITNIFVPLLYQWKAVYLRLSASIKRGLKLSHWGGNHSPEVFGMVLFALFGAQKR